MGLAFAVLLAFSVHDAVATEFFVSPHGNDGNPGTMEEPFTTLTHARDMVRKIAKSNGQALGFDVHSLEGAPLFVSPENGDYRVRPESPALILGFNNFPMDQFGVNKPGFKQEVALEPRI
jgi:hypothetical protein